MKILHIIPGLANASGPTHVVSRYAERFVQRGHEVSVFHVSGRGKDAVPLPEGVENRPFPAQRAKSWAYSPPLFRALKNEATQFDIVHVHALWCFTNIAARLVLNKPSSPPYIVRPAGSLEPWSMSVSAARKKWYFRAIEKPILNRAAAIHAMSTKETEHIAAFNLQPPIWTIPNGIDAIPPVSASELEQVRASKGIHPDTTVLLFLGRLHFVKNLPFLFNVLEKLKTNHSSIHLMVAGPDQHAYADTLKKQVVDQGLEKQVSFLGEVNGDEKSKWVAAADALCLPSLSENFGNVVLEALASGTAVFASNTTPWAELDGWQCGRCLPLEEPAWVTAISDAISKNQLANWGTRARAVAENEFSWDVIASRIEDAYQTLLSS